MGLLYKLYVWLKRRFDPRTGPEMTLGLEHHNTYIHARTYCLPARFKGESADPNSWLSLPEFSVPLATFGTSAEMRWIKEYFTAQSSSSPSKTDPAVSLHVVNHGEKKLWPKYPTPYIEFATFLEDQQKWVEARVDLFEFEKICDHLLKSNSFELAKLGQEIRYTKHQFDRIVNEVQAGTYKEAGK